MHELADAREADRAPEVPADHREARGAAVHLVDLPHEREAADAARARLTKRPSVSNGRRVGRRRPRASVLIDLRVADLLLGRRSGRQHLLGEAGGHARDVLVVVLRDALLQLGAELRAACRAAAGSVSALSASSEHGVSASAPSARGTPRNTDISPKYSPRPSCVTCLRRPPSAAHTRTRP